MFVKKKNKGKLTYTEVAQHYANDGLQFGRRTFANSSINMSVLREVTDSLSSIQRNNQIKPNESIKDLIQTVKRAILQAPQPFKTREDAHSEFLNVLSRIGYNTSSAQEAWLANVKTTSVIKEKERLTTPDALLIQIHGEVLEGKPTVGSYCRLHEKEGVYKITKIGYAGNLAESFVGHTTKFTLKKL